MLHVSFRLKNVAFILTVAVVSLSLTYFTLAWSEPLNAPPVCPLGSPGCDAPINVSSNTQNKTGILGALSFQDTVNPAYFVDPNGNLSGYSAILNGSIGIGTTAPGTALHIYGNYPSGIKIERSSPQNSNIQYTNTVSSMYAGLNPTGGFGIGSAADLSSAYLTVLNTGNVGIGASPGYKFDVNGTARIRDIFAAGGQNLIIGDDAFLSDVDVANTVGIYGAQNNDRAGIRLGSDGSYIFGDNGNIGVGTTSPAYKFDVRANSIKLGLEEGGGGQLILSHNPADNKIYMEAFSSDGLSSASELLLTGRWGVNVPQLSLYANKTYMTGSVGVGTVPVQKFEVAGMMKIGSDATVPAAGTMRWSGADFEGYDGIAWKSFTSGGPGSGLWAANGTNINNTNTGNVGIGTTAPTAMLDVRGNIKSETAAGTWNWLEVNRGGDTIYFGSDNANRGIWSNSTRDVGIYTNGSAKLFVNGNSGNVGIGTTAPAYKLDVVGRSRIQSGGGSAGIWFMDAANTSDRAFVGMSNDNYVGLWGQGTGWSFNMNVNNGNVGIGTATPSEKLDVNGNVKAAAFFYSSDERLKNNIQKLGGSLEKILKLDGISFDWKNSGEKSIGLTAQNVETVFPELVKTDGSTGMKSVEYGNLVAPLIEAIKEQQKMIEEQQVEINNLKALIK